MNEEFSPLEKCLKNRVADRPTHFCHALLSRVSYLRTFKQFIEDYFSYTRFEYYRIIGDCMNFERERPKTNTERDKMTSKMSQDHGA